MSRLLSIGTYSENVHSLGPGNRFALWVQGCPFNCKKCISPDWIPFKRANVLSIEEVVNLIKDVNPVPDGITISGGEPFMQASTLTSLVKILQIEIPDLNVIVFTGFKYKQLQWSVAQEFLSVTDVLIAGLYVHELNDGIGLRGSSNQEIIFLTDRLKEYESYFTGIRPPLEFFKDDTGELIVGIPDSTFIT